MPAQAAQISAYRSSAGSCRAGAPVTTSYLVSFSTILKVLHDPERQTRTSRSSSWTDPTPVDRSLVTGKTGKKRVHRVPLSEQPIRLLHMMRTWLKNRAGHCDGDRPDLYSDEDAYIWWGCR